VSRHQIRIPMKWPRLYRGHGIGSKSAKCGRHVRYWRSDVLASMAAQEAATAKGDVQ
jgi:hypothetical protein